MLKKLLLFLLALGLPAYGQYYDYAKCDLIAKALERKQKEWAWLGPYLEKDKKGIMEYHKRNLAPKYCSRLFKRDEPFFEKCILQLISPDLPFMPKEALKPITTGKTSFYNDPLLARIERKKNDDIELMTQDHYETLREIRADYRKAKCP
jgi:hypothetical protein